MKKPGIGLMIAVGKQNGPPPRYKATADEPSEPRPTPSGKGGDPAPGQDMNRLGQDVAPHSSAETPGADILSDAMAPLTDLGLSPEEAKATLGKMFTAIAKCFAGNEPQGEESMDYGQGGGPLG